MSSTMSLIYKRKSRGPRIEPCGTPAFTEVQEELAPGKTDDNKSLKNYSACKELIMVLYLLHIRMPNSTKSRIKTKKLESRKKNVKKKHLNATGLEPTSFKC